MPPRFFFVIDVSYVAANAGALPVICQAIRDSLDRLPGGERTQIGFLTFDSTLHFYNLASRLSQPQMMVRPALNLSCFLDLKCQHSRKWLPTVMHARRSAVLLCSSWHVFSIYSKRWPCSGS